jgi:hypothetical protein
MLTQIVMLKALEKKPNEKRVLNLLLSLKKFHQGFGFMQSAETEKIINPRYI